MQPGPEPDPDELRSMFEAHAPVLHAWMRARVGPALRRHIEPEDLLQEVWLRAAQHLPADRPIAKPRAWLLRISSFVVIEAVRDQRRGARVGAGGSSMQRALHQVPDTVTSITKRVARNEQLERALAEVDQLERLDREVLLGCCLEERTSAEVGARLGLSADATRKRKERVLARLRELWQALGLAG